VKAAVRQLRELFEGGLVVVDRLERQLSWAREALGEGPMVVSPARRPEPPAPSATPAVLGVTATCWLNREDEGREREMAYAWSPKVVPGLGKTLVAFALPARVPQGTMVTARSAARSVRGPVIDVGPWRVTDPYWRLRRSPWAEMHRGAHVRLDQRAGQWDVDITGETVCNGAGVDATPAAWAALLGKTAEEMWDSSPSGPLDLTIEEAAGEGLELLAPHFSVAEAERTSHGPNRLPADLVSVAARFAREILEPIRARLGGPLRIASWYRSPAVNAAVGGHAQSRHLVAEAADVARTPDHWRAIQAAMAAAEVVGIRILVETRGGPHYHIARGGNQPPGIHWDDGVDKEEWET
jgi:hypothetical protein